MAENLLENFSESQRRNIYYFLQKKLVEEDTNTEFTDSNLLSLHNKFSQSLSSKNINEINEIDEINEIINEIVNEKINDEQREKEISKEISKGTSSECCCNVVELVPSTSSIINFIIDSPGKYCLRTDDGIIQWTKRIFIFINSDNVSLDLNNTKIMQNVNTGTSNFLSMFLAGNRKNISIFNGTFNVNPIGYENMRINASFSNCNNLALNNIRIISGVTNTNINDNQIAFVIQGSNTISLDNFHIYGGGNNTPFLVDSSSDIRLNNCSVSNRSLISPAAGIVATGFSFQNVSNVFISNCHVSNLICEYQAVSLPTITVTLSGFHFGGISNQNININDCTGINIKSTGLSGATSIFLMVNTRCGNVKNCIGNDFSSTQTAISFFIVLCDTIVIENCQGNYGLSTCQDTHGIAYYFSNNGIIKNCVLTNMVAENPSGGYTEKCDGIEVFVVNNCVVSNCSTSENRAVNPIRHYVTGMTCGQCNNISFINCISRNNTCISSYGEGRGIGFGPALDSRNLGESIGTIWDNCTSENNLGNNSKESIGFDLYRQQNAIMVNCITTNNGIGIKSGGQYDLGNPIDVRCDTIPIIFNVDNDEKNVLVKSNIITNNTYAGIYDVAIPFIKYTSNTFFNNRKNCIR
jgi:hypothetical protein